MIKVFLPLKSLFKSTCSYSSNSASFFSKNTKLHKMLFNILRVSVSVKFLVIHANARDNMFHSNNSISPHLPHSSGIDMVMPAAVLYVNASNVVVLNLFLPEIITTCKQFCLFHQFLYEPQRRSLSAEKFLL